MFDAIGADDEQELLAIATNTSNLVHFKGGLGEPALSRSN